MSRIWRIGVIGYSGQKFDEKAAKKLIENGMKAMIALLETTVSNIMVVSGYTALGIPLLAYEWATQHNVTTIGIACSKAKDYECYPVDYAHIVGDSWGDESEKFIDYCDAVLKIGGGKQSENEFEAFISHGKPSLEYDLKADV